MIRQCAADSEHLTIGIGSAQYSHDPENPFTAGERYEMISETMREEGVGNFCIVPVEDLNRYSVWVAHVVSMSPPFSAIYSNNPFTRRLFQEAGFDVKDSPLYNRAVYSGTEVRRRMLADEDWRSLVPDSVADFIDTIDGVNRLKDIAGGR
jgi:nicotinamide-nucleotide adenylyltransferase